MKLNWSQAESTFYHVLRMTGESGKVLWDARGVGVDCSLQRANEKYKSCIP